MVLATKIINFHINLVFCLQLFTFVNIMADHNKKTRLVRIKETIVQEAEDIIKNDPGKSIGGYFETCHNLTKPKPKSKKKPK